MRFVYPGCAKQASFAGLFVARRSLFCCARGAERQ
jgi:hypothetical protein